MINNLDKSARRIIRKRRSKRIIGTAERPRLVFCESNRYLRAQAIDDSRSHTLLYSSSETLAKKDNSVSYSKKDKGYAILIAEAVANKLKELGYQRIVFDRNSKPYHGKVKAFCDTIRKLGIVF